MATDISNLGNKVANDGATPQGILTYTDWNTLVKAVQEQQTASSEETQARQKADGTLQQAINGEARERTAGDAALQQAITKEATALKEADTALKTRLDEAVKGISQMVGSEVASLQKMAVVPFSRMVAGAEVLESGVGTVEEVVYVRSARTFAGVWRGKHYGSWRGSDVYREAGRGVRRNAVYISGGRLWMWSDTAGDLVAVGGEQYLSEGEYAALTLKRDDVTYFVFEDEETGRTGSDGRTESDGRTWSDRSSGRTESDEEGDA